MGISVYGELSSNEYFCISQIKKSAMEKHGLNMTIKELRERARNSKPFGWVLTGSIYVIGYHKKTSIYRYADFKEQKEDSYDSTNKPTEMPVASNI